jgi:hypothetical protein
MVRGCWPRSNADAWIRIPASSKPDDGLPIYSYPPDHLENEMSISWM